MATHTTIGSAPAPFALTAVMKAVADYFRQGSARRPADTGVWTHGVRGL
jgi:hypothetical protein